MGSCRSLTDLLKPAPQMPITPVSPIPQAPAQLPSQILPPHTEMCLGPQHATDDSEAIFRKNLTCSVGARTPQRPRKQWGKTWAAGMLGTTLDLQEVLHSKPVCIHTGSTLRNEGWNFQVGISEIKTRPLIPARVAQSAGALGFVSNKESGTRLLASPLFAESRNAAQVSDTQRVLPPVSAAHSSRSQEDASLLAPGRSVSMESRPFVRGKPGDSSQPASPPTAPAPKKSAGVKTCGKNKPEQDTRRCHRPSVSSRTDVSSVASPLPAAMRRSKSMPASEKCAEAKVPRGCNGRLPKSTASAAAGAGSAAAKKRAKCKKMSLPFAYSGNDPRHLHIEACEGRILPEYLVA